MTDHPITLLEAILLAVLLLGGIHLLKRRLLRPRENEEKRPPP